MAPKVDENKARRALNWTKEEEGVLVEAVTTHYDKLFGAFSKSLTDSQKKSLWVAVASTVSHKRR